MKAAKAAAILIPLALLALAGYGGYRLFGGGFKVNEPPASLSAAPTRDIRAMPDEPAQATGPLAVLESYEGEVEVVRQGRAVGPEAGMELAAGDEVAAGTGASARILWLGYGRTVLDQDTRVGIRRLADEAGAWRSRLKLDSGRIWTRFERLLTGSSAFEVRSGDVITAVRGTSFGVELGLEAMRIQVTDSAVAASYVRDREPTRDERARGLADPVEEAVGETRTVAAGQELRTAAAIPREGPAPTLPEPFPMSEEALTDPFIRSADVPLGADELAGRPPTDTPGGGGGATSSASEVGGGAADMYDGLNLLNVTPDGSR